MGKFTANQAEFIGSHLEMYAKLSGILAVHPKLQPGSGAEESKQAKQKTPGNAYAEVANFLEKYQQLITAYIAAVENDSPNIADCQKALEQSLITFKAKVVEKQLNPSLNRADEAKTIYKRVFTEFNHHVFENRATDGKKVIQFQGKKSEEEQKQISDMTTVGLSDIDMEKSKRQISGLLATGRRILIRKPEDEKIPKRNYQQWEERYQWTNKPQLEKSGTFSRSYTVAAPEPRSNTNANANTPGRAGLRESLPPIIRMGERVSVMQSLLDPEEAASGRDQEKTIYEIKSGGHAELKKKAEAYHNKRHLSSVNESAGQTQATGRFGSVVEKLASNIDVTAISDKNAKKRDYKWEMGKDVVNTLDLIAPKDDMRLTEQQMQDRLDEIYVQQLDLEAYLNGTHPKKPEGFSFGSSELPPILRETIVATKKFLDECGYEPSPEIGDTSALVFDDDDVAHVQRSEAAMEAPREDASLLNIFKADDYAQENFFKFINTPDLLGALHERQTGFDRILDLDYRLPDADMMTKFILKSEGMPEGREAQQDYIYNCYNAYFQMQKIKNTYISDQAKGANTGANQDKSYSALLEQISDAELDYKQAFTTLISLERNGDSSSAWVAQAQKLGSAHKQLQSRIREFTGVTMQAEDKYAVALGHIKLPVVPNIEVQEYVSAIDKSLMDFSIAACDVANRIFVVCNNSNNKIVLSEANQNRISQLPEAIGEMATAIAEKLPSGLPNQLQDQLVEYIVSYHAYQVDPLKPELAQTHKQAYDALKSSLRDKQGGRVQQGDVVGIKLAMQLKTALIDKASENSLMQLPEPTGSTQTATHRM